MNALGELAIGKVRLQKWLVQTQQDCGFVSNARSKSDSGQLPFFDGYICPKKKLPCQFSGSKSEAKKSGRIADCAGVLVLVDKDLNRAPHLVGMPCPCRHYLQSIPRLSWNLLWQLPWDLVDESRGRLKFEQNVRFVFCEQGDVLNRFASVLFALSAQKALLGAEKLYQNFELVFSEQQASSEAVKFFENAVRALRLVVNESYLALSWSMLKKSYLLAVGGQVTEIDIRREELLQMLSQGMQVILELSGLNLRSFGTIAKENMAFSLFIEDLYNAGVYVTMISGLALISSNLKAANRASASSSLLDHSRNIVQQRDSKGRLRIREQSSVMASAKKLDSVSLLGALSSSNANKLLHLLCDGF